jgi:cell division protein FtsQ
MPLEFGDPDEDLDAHGFRPRSRSRFEEDEPQRPWWRPASKLGRMVLGGLALAALGALTAAGMALRLTLERNANFRIAGTQDIQATGLTEVSRAQLLPVFGEDIGRNVFFVPLNERRRQLEQIPWVQHATVMRLLPDHIRVAVVERQPVAFTRNGSHIGLVDADGVLLSMSPAAMARHHYSFPVLTGIDPGDPLAARRTRMAVYLRLMSDLDSSGQHYSQQISEIDLTDPEDARVIMPERGGDVLAHFGEDRFLERYQRFKAHIAEWRQQYPHLSSVDLRYDQQVVLDMASGGETPAPALDAKPQPGAPAVANHPAAKVHSAAKRSEARARTESAAAKRKRAAENKKRAEKRHAAMMAARRHSAYMVLHQHDQESGRTKIGSRPATRYRAPAVTAPSVAQGG